MVPELMTVDDAAHYLKLSAFTVRQKAAKGELPAAKVGRQWQFRRADLVNWIGRGGTLSERAFDAALLAEVEDLAKDPTQKWVPAEQVDAEYAR
jgi:excisionase family DNA binding protein